MAVLDIPAPEHRRVGKQLKVNQQVRGRFVCKDDSSRRHGGAPDKELAVIAKAKIQDVRTSFEPASRDAQRRVIFVARTPSSAHRRLNPREPRLHETNGTRRRASTE